MLVVDSTMPQRHVAYAQAQRTGGPQLGFVLPLIGIAAGIIGKIFDKSRSKEERIAAEAFAEAEIARARADMMKTKSRQTLMYVGVAGLVAVVLLKGR